MALIWSNLEESNKCRGYMNFTARFGVTISNLNYLLERFQDVTMLARVKVSSRNN